MYNTELKTISNLEELFKYASNILEKKEEYIPVQLKNKDFYIALHIEGETWDDRVDERLARYVIALQKSLNDLLYDYAPNEDNEEILVKVKTEKGSLVTLADIASFLQKVCTPMTSEQTFTFSIVAIGAIGGYFYLNRLFKYLESKDTNRTELAQSESYNTTLQEAIAPLARIAESKAETFTQYEKAPRQILSKLQENDTVKINNSLPIDATTISKIHPKRLPRTETQITYADGEYTLDKVSYAEGEVILELSQGDYGVKAYLWQMDEDDATNFMDIITERCRNESLPINIELQVNIEHTKRAIKFGVVLGIDGPRKNKTCKTLEEICNSLK